MIFLNYLNLYISAAAIANIQLLARVAQHKQIYFRAGWAKYGQAKQGTLKVVPPTYIEDALRKDYLAMQEMCF
jgi:hypothetical protein